MIAALAASLVLTLALCVKRSRRSSTLHELKEPLLEAEEAVAPLLGATARDSTGRAVPVPPSLRQLWLDDEWLLMPVPMQFARDMHDKGVLTASYQLPDEVVKLHQLLRETPRVVSNPHSLRTEGVAWASMSADYRPDLWDSLLGMYTLAAPYGGTEALSRQVSVSERNHSVSR